MDSTEALPAPLTVSRAVLLEAAPTAGRAREWPVRTSALLRSVGTGDCIVTAGRLWATSSEACVEEGASASQRRC